MNKIIQGDCLEKLKELPDNSVDSIVTDPPYELGFMGKSWDNTGIANNVELWKECLRVLKPGGHLLAFSGTRTYHRMASAIEDAGFEVRDMIEWVYGSGFPKSLNIGKSVEALVTTGNASKNGFSDLNGEKLERGNWGISKQAKKHGFRAKNYDTETTKTERIGQLDPTTDEAKLWNGYGTALKPAHEPCVLARKPLEKGHSVAQNVLKHGTGGLNIDGTRVGTGNGGEKPEYKPNTKNKVYGNNMGGGEWNNTQGRFPANLIHDGSDEVEAVFPQTKAGVAVRRNKGIVASKNVTFNANDPTNTEDVGYGDSGSASRYFYCAKASKSERNAGLEGFEDRPRPTMGSGIGGQPDQQRANNKNVHPTVKPLSLTKYLATLIKPPTGGRLLVPFSGSGSEMIGALQAGWEYVEGVELTEEYIPIAEARIKHWVSKPVQVALDV